MELLLRDVPFFVGADLERLARVEREEAIQTWLEQRGVSNAWQLGPLLAEANLTDSGYTYTQEENFVEIAHSDCTFGRYTVFKDSGIFVQPGDWVEAGQPLGIVGGEKYTEGPHVRFSVRYHLDQDVLDKDGQATDRTHHWAYVPLNFWTKDKGKLRLAAKTPYTSEHPAELVTQEMTRKDARKWKETHKSS